MKHTLFSTIFVFCVSFLWAQTPTDEEKLERYKDYLTLKQKQISAEQALKQKKEDSLSTFRANLLKEETAFTVKNDTLLAIQKRLEKTTASLTEKNTLISSKKETLSNSSKELTETKQKRDADQAQLTKVNSQLQTNKNDLQVHQKQLADFQEKVDLVEKKIGINTSTLESKKQNLTQKQSQLKVSRENLSLQQKKLEELKGKEKTILANITVTQTDIQTKYQKVADFNTSLTNSSNSLTQQMTVLDEKNGQMKAKTTEILAIKKEIETQELTLKNTTLSKVDIQNTQQKINSLHTKQSTLFSEVIALNNQIKAVGIEVETIIQRLQGLEKDKVLATNDLTNAHQTHLNLVEEKNSLTTNIQSVSLEVDRLNKEETALQYDIQQLTTDIAALEKEKIELAKEQDWVTVKRNEEKVFVENLTKNIATGEAEQKTLTASLENHNAKITTTQGFVDQLNKEIPVLESEIKALTSTQETLSKKEKITTDEKDKIGRDAEKLKVVVTRLETEIIPLRANANIAPILLQGIDLGLKNDIKGAAHDFKKAGNQEPKSREPHYLSAFSEYVLKDYPKALEELGKATVADARYIDAYLLKAEINEARGNYMGAIHDYNTVNSIDINHAKSYEHKGRIFHDFLMEWDLACENWDKAIALKSTFAQNEKDRHCNIPLENRRYMIAQITKMATDNSYGYSETKPIRVGTKDKEDVRENRRNNIDAYLELLRDDRGHKIEYKRVRSCCPYPSKSALSLGGQALLEEYEIKYRDILGKPIVKLLYFTYYEYEKPLVPVGFKTNFEIK